MTAATKPFRMDVGGAQIEIPADVVVRNFLDSLQQGAARETIILTGGIPRIGEQWPSLGGVNAGLMRGQDGPDYYLIVPTHSDAFIREIAWGSRGTDEAGAKSEWDGAANTRALIESGHSHPAAEQIAALVIDGHSDFYLPARREIRLAWVNVPELFEDGYYWTSTQFSSSYAWCQYFDDGGQSSYGKGESLRARAVRRLFI